jgi:RNA polymerase sigma-70 factor, ECF subfamily
MRSLPFDICLKSLCDKVRIFRFQILKNLNGEEDMAMRSNNVKDDIIACIPHLRSFAISLCGNKERGDDLVQETLLRALTKISTFEEGTNLKAWLFTILRNKFYSEFRKTRREVQDTEGVYSNQLYTLQSQDSHMELSDLQNALKRLSDDQREALLMISVQRMSYEEVAEICKCQVGTVKSRVNRARNSLADMLGYDRGEPFVFHPSVATHNHIEVRVS